MSGVSHGAVITTLIGEEVVGDEKSQGTLAAPNGSLYGMPYYNRRVVKFNPEDKSMTEIGPVFIDLDASDGKWKQGVMTDTGVIYSFPSGFGSWYDRGILKIDTNTDDVTEDGIHPYPEDAPHEDGDAMWLSCAVALDGCIYFMPYGALRIMKLDPNNDDIMTSVGDDLGDEEEKYIGTVIGIDGH